MKKSATTLLLPAVLLMVVVPVFSAPPPDDKPVVFWTRVKATIEKYLDRPYVWGSSGLKSFDCSGFVWRVLHENNLFIKRTTARKLFVCLPEVSPEGDYSPGTVVFFSDLKHCGIVADGNSFYHAESSIGTNLSRFDPYWRPKVFGFRALPKDSP